MRSRFVLPLSTLPLALTLIGCGMGSVDHSVSSATAGAVHMSGTVHGGQQPINGSVIAVYAAGNTGYGSAAVELATTTTNANGQYSFSGLVCPSANSPLYVLSIGGYVTPTVQNPQAVEGAAVGTCNQILGGGVIPINEITTVALGYSLSHYFSTTTPTISSSCTVQPGGGACTNAVAEGFGGPASSGTTTAPYSLGLVHGILQTVPAMTVVSAGQPQPGSTSGGVTSTVEVAKINTLANALAACVNSAGSSSGQCQVLLPDTNASDTLQSAVNLALTPTINPSAIFTLAGTNPPFSPNLTTAPNDWSIGLSYTSSSFGLNVPAAAVSTIDIDASGRVWFPSNGLGTTGIGYFDPAALTFNGPYAAGLIQPTQVVINGTSLVWANDLGASNLVGTSITSPSVIGTAYPVSGATALPSVTINYDNSVHFGVTTTSNYGDGELAYNTSSQSYASSTQILYTGSEIYYPVMSIAGNSTNSDGVAEASASAQSFVTTYVGTSGAPPSQYATQLNSGTAYTGQMIFDGDDFTSLRASLGGGNSPDALCFFHAPYVPNCQQFESGTVPLYYGTYGLAIDGVGTMWATISGNSALLSAPVTRTDSNTGTPLYSDSNGNVDVTEYLHGSGNGGTIGTPYGIAIDSSGNVWVSNRTGTGTANGFTLTELVGLAAPTITPVSAQIYPTNSPLQGTKPQY